MPRSSTFRRPSSVWVSLLGVVVGVVIVSCDRAGSEPKRPLRELAATRADTGASSLSHAARAALARGNADYRAARFGAALEAYRDASRDAPASAAPYFGILMAAQKLGNKALSDSASLMIRKLSGTDSAEVIHRTTARTEAKS